MAYLPGNHSVSGTVGASIIGAPPANLFVGGNAVTTSNPVAVQPPLSGHLDVHIIESSNASVITATKGSIAAVIVGGSIAASFTPPANQSVSGAVGIEGTPTFLQLAGSVLATSATISPAANQSVSGTVGASTIGIVPVSFAPGTADSFGHLITGGMYNQIDIPFFRASVANLVAVTTANGGSAISSVGGAIFSTGTNADGSSKGVTPSTLSYRAGSEIYAYFTARFTATGDGNSYQRIGPFNASDGMFVGYQGSTFGIGLRNNTADTFIPKAQWNVDTLVGGAGSRFTRGGAPEAIDVEQVNVYRVRLGWLGAAPIEYEALSPDGNWVTFHQVRQPNSSSILSIENPDLPITVDVAKASGTSSVLNILTGCWGGGTTTPLTKIGDTLTSSTFSQLTRAVITGETTAGGGGNFVNVKVNPSGTLQIGGSVDVAGSVASHIKSGSVIAVLGGNTSVVVSNFPTNQNVSGSVVATQGTTPWIIGSIYGNISGSVAVTGTVTANAGTVPGSVVAFQSNPSVFQALAGLMSTNASVITVGTAAANQSVSGTVDIGVTPGSVASHIKSGSVIAVLGGNTSVVVANTNLNVSGSVAAWLQSTNASVITVGTAAANQSVSGTVDAAQIGAWRVSVISSTPSSMLVGASVFGNVGISGTPNVNTAGSVVAFQSNPSVLQTLAGLMSTNASVITVGTAAANQSVSGTVDAAQIGAWRTSVISSTPSSLLTGASIFGQLPAGTAPLGSVATLQGTNPWIITGSVQAAVSGSVASYPLGTIVTSLVSTVPSSVIVGASIFGLPPVNVTNTNLNVGGSVVAFQGSAPWANTNVGSIITTQIGSVITVSKDSSVVAVLQAPSIVGSYAEDAAHATADKGLFTLGVRNDAVSSLTSAERDYSPIAVDDAGRNIVVPFAGQQACIISYFGSVVSGSVTLIKASVIGSRSYITDFWVANTGSVAQLITFQGGDTSVIGYTIAPAGGGSNSPGIAIPLRTTLSQDLAFKATGTSSVVYMTVKGYQAP